MRGIIRWCVWSLGRVKAEAVKWDGTVKEKPRNGYFPIK
jgi:hypothetical protein